VRHQGRGDNAGKEKRSKCDCTKLTCSSKIQKDSKCSQKPFPTKPKSNQFFCQNFCFGLNLDSRSSTSSLPIVHSEKIYFAKVCFSTYTKVFNSTYSQTRL
jgi:hypothetical protein